MSENKPHKILVVDDVPSLAEMLSISLQGDGYDVTAAASAAQALTLARSRKFDLVISDLAMPRTDGYKLARELRQLPSYREIPLIAITGFGDCGDERIWEAGFTECITKPLDLDRLSEMVAKLLASISE